MEEEICGGKSIQIYTNCTAKMILKAFLNKQALQHSTLKLEETRKEKENQGQRKPQHISL